MPIYYVDSSLGNNANNGLSVDSAFQTIAYALGSNTLVAGDSLLIRSGMYTCRDGAALLNQSGSQNAMIVISGYQAETPCITTCIIYTGGWLNSDTNIWRTASGASIGPNSPINVWRCSDYTLNSGSIAFLHKKVTSQFLAEDDYYGTSGVPPSGNVYIWTTSNPNTLESQGWFYRFQFTSIGLASGTASWVKFNNIVSAFNYEGFSFRGQNIEVANCTALYNPSRGFDNVNIDTTTTVKNIFVHNCVARYGIPGDITVAGAPDQHGFKFGSNDQSLLVGYAYNIVVQNCISTDNGYHGFQASEGSENVYFGGCYSANNNIGFHNDGAGFRLGTQKPSNNHCVQNCVSVGNGKYGVYVFGSVGGIIISQNIISANSVSGVYFDRVVPVGDRGNYITNNIFHHNSKSSIGMLSAKDVFILNNDFYLNASDDILMQDLGSIVATCTNITIENNIFYLNSGMHAFNAESNHGVTSDYNNIFSTSGRVILSQGTEYTLAEYAAFSPPNESHSITVDPTLYFKNTAQLQFMMSSGYPGISSGLTLKTVPVDFVGKSRGQKTDIGAYQFGNYVNFQGTSISHITVS